MSSQSIFDFNETPVRVIVRDEQPWFVAADVCRVLELTNTSKACESLDDDEAAITISATRSKGGATQARQMTIISESGLYSLVFRSRKPEAKLFRKWVTSEVLPELRRTGSFQAQQPKTLLADPALDRLKGRVDYLTALGVDATTAVQAALSLRQWKRKAPRAVGVHQTVMNLVTECLGASTSTLERLAIQAGIPRATFYRTFKQIKEYEAHYNSLVPAHAPTLARDG